MATHSSVLAWEIPWTEEPGGLQSMESQKESDMTKQLYNNKYTHTHIDFNVPTLTLRKLKSSISKINLEKNFTKEGLPQQSRCSPLKELSCSSLW